MVGFTVSYGDIDVRSQSLSKRKTQTEPTVDLRLDPAKLYTLLMTDPDAPTPSWLHWLVINIPGSIAETVNGTTIAKYTPPSPPSGRHRYIFTLYEQLASIMVKQLEEGESRGGFDTKEFESQNSLRKVKTVYFTVDA